MSLYPIAVVLVGVALPAVAHAEPTPETCLIGAHPGFDDADAGHAADLVCDELARFGYPLGRPVLDPDAYPGAFRIELHPLGAQVFLSVTYESPIGTEVASRRVLLRDIADVATVAPRIAEALVSGRDLEPAAAGVEAAPTSDAYALYEATPGAPALQSEARLVDRRMQPPDGGFRWGVGVGGAFFTGGGGEVGPILALLAAYERPQFALDTALRIAIPTGGCEAGTCDETMAITWSVGGRFYLREGAWSPYAGSGLALGMMSVETDALSGNEFGLGAYADLGLELLRTGTMHLAFELRVDLPFYALTNRAEDGSPIGKRYVAPVSLGTTLTW